MPHDPTPDEVVFDVLRASLENGANVWNGGDFYGTSDANSLHLLNRYFTKYPEDAVKVVLCIKTGVIDRAFNLDCSPEHLRKAIDTCNRILDGKKSIDIFGPCRTDPKVPVETAMEALGELVKAGKIGGIQLSEVSAATIRRAAKVHKVDMVEAEVSLWSPDVFSNGVADTCAELGIVVVAHTPLGSGMLTGKFQTVEDMGTSMRRQFPRFQGESFRKNLQLVNAIAEVAQRKGCTNAQLALSWVKRGNGKQGCPWMVTIPGASNPVRVKENCEDIELSKDDLEAIEQILAENPVVGRRYPEAYAKLSEY